MREAIERHRGAAVVVAIALLAGATLVLLQARGGAESLSTARSYFSVDDGRTWFVDRADKVPPFEQDGKTAYRAYVFACGDREFVGLLERFTPEAQQTLAAARQGRTDPPGRPFLSVLDELLASETQVKKPGDAAWVHRGDRAAATAVLDVRCPDGTPARPVMP